MKQSGNHHQDAVRAYYAKRESRWGYRWILGGTRHFGYYTVGRRGLSISSAQRLMQEKVADSLGLPVGSLVLDAGCGEGSAALTLAEYYGYRVTGVDLVPESIGHAQSKAISQGLVAQTQFAVADYSNLPFPRHSFSGLYTLEALVHAEDLAATLAEFGRVLKPGGRLALFEYSMPAANKLTPEELATYRTVIQGTAMAGAWTLVHGSFHALLERAGFSEVKVTDITQRVMPMAQRLAQICYLPYKLACFFGWRERAVNVTSGVELYRIRGSWRYNIVTARKLPR